MKRILIDAIVGQGITSHEAAAYWVDQGLAEFCGNQHNEDWRFKREVLDKMSEVELVNVYYKTDFSGMDDFSDMDDLADMDDYIRQLKRARDIN